MSPYLNPLYLELRRLRPERELHFHPVLGLRKNEVLVREFQLDASGAKIGEDLLRSWIAQPESIQLFLALEVAASRSLPLSDCRN